MLFETFPKHGDDNPSKSKFKHFLLRSVWQNFLIIQNDLFSKKDAKNILVKKYALIFF